MSATAPKELVYGIHDGTEMKGDYYRPDGNGPFPTLVLVHGGGWEKGSKERWKNWGPYLATRGVATFAASYRLSKPGRPTHPQSVWDVKSAVQYVRANAVELGVDPKRLGGMGTSSGAHIVSLLTLAGDDPLFISPYADEPAHKVSGRLELAIVICGIYDMMAQWEHDQMYRPLDHITEKYIGGNPMSMRQKFYEASPVFHASLEKAAGTKWLVAYGTGDDVVDYRTQALPFMTHISRAGALLRTVELPGADHFWTTEQTTSNFHSRVFAERLQNFLTSAVGWLSLTP